MWPVRIFPCTNTAKLIDAAQWDGSDLFIVWPLPRFIFVTDPAAEIIRANRLTGAVLVEPEALVLIHGYSPGRLSRWMPEAGARSWASRWGFIEEVASDKSRGFGAK